MSNAKVRARRRRRANRAWTGAMTPVVLSVVPVDVLTFGRNVRDWGRRVAAEWAEKGVLP